MLAKGKFKNKRSQQAPQISTASLPDIVFILLFFFMMISQVRTDELLIDAKVPTVGEASELKNSPLIQQIYIGKPKSSEDVTDRGFAIQLGSRIGTLNDVGAYVEACRSSLSSEKQKDMVIALKVDSEVPISLIDDVKYQLQKAKQYRINYYVITTKK